MKVRAQISAATKREMALILGGEGQGVSHRDTHQHDSHASRGRNTEGQDHKDGCRDTHPSVFMGGSPRVLVQAPMSGFNTDRSLVYREPSAIEREQAKQLHFFAPSGSAISAHHSRKLLSLGSELEGEEYGSEAGQEKKT